MDEHREDGKESRPRREAQVVDFKEYHRSGNTGKVAAAVHKIETPDKEEHTTITQKNPHSRTRRALSGETPAPNTPDSSPLEHISEMADIEKLREELNKQKELNNQIKQELEAAKLRNELQEEKMKQKEWEMAKDQLDREQSEAVKKHEEALIKIKEAAKKKLETEPINAALEYIKEQAKASTAEEEAKAKKQQEVADQLKALVAKQQEMTEAAREAAAGCEKDPQIQKLLQQLSMPETQEKEPQDEQAKLMEHLINTLQGKEQETKASKQKEILRQFLVESNKTPTTGGATTLKPDLLKKLTGESDTFDMTEWLAKFNRQNLEEGRCDTCQDECKHHKKSGMLDKATTNIQHKEIWPQKNLLEDWADEDMEFKHMQFEHFVAGETRTIEVSTDPAQILGRLRLLRRMAYAKLRGYEWSLIRKMYAAILRSIETRENTWESNFDKYEGILFRRPPYKREDRTTATSGTNNNKKWFCRDWNKGNCSKNAPHKSWFGTGTSAVQRTVLHMCAICYMKDKAQKDHPEGHDSCPHKDA